MLGQRRSPAGAVEQKGRKRRADELAATDDSLYTGDDVGNGAVFEQVALRAQIEGAIKERFVLVHGQKNDGRLNPQ